MIEPRVRKLLDALIEDHAPHKFGPCICDLCQEYEALTAPPAVPPHYLHCGCDQCRASDPL